MADAPEPCDAPEPSGALESLVERHTRVLRPDAPYRPPTAAEDEAVVALAAAVGLGRPPSPASGLTVAAIGGRWSVRGSPGDPCGWPLVLAPSGRAPTVLVEVPHPCADLDTERVGAGVLGRVPGAGLVVAGAHRRAGASAPAGARSTFPADPAARPDTLLARFVAALVARTGLAQVQVHGFADRGWDGPDVVLSPGRARVGPLVAALARELAGRGERVRWGSDPAVADLAGRRNEQGRVAARHGTEFAHLELSRSLRRDPRRREAVAAAVAAAVPSTPPGNDHPAPYDHRT